MGAPQMVDKFDFRLKQRSGYSRAVVTPEHSVFTAVVHAKVDLEREKRGLKKRLRLSFELSATHCTPPSQLMSSYLQCRFRGKHLLAQHTSVEILSVRFQ